MYECVLGPTAMEREQGNGAAMEYSLAAMASCCRRAWLKEENSKGEIENAEGETAASISCF